MAYKLDPKLEIGTNIKRIIRELDDNIINEIKYSQSSKHEIVHYVRKMCKEIRGVLRFLKPNHKKIYNKEYTWYRNAAKDISFVRDLQSKIEAADRLFKHYNASLDKKSYWFIYDYLIKKRDAVYNDEIKLGELLDSFSTKIKTAKKRIDSWHIKEKGFKTIKKGLKKTYCKGKRTMNIAYKKPNTENFHKWRKSVKYHWFHLRLVSAAWPDFLDTYTTELENLSKILGNEHDLAILKQDITETEWDVNRVPLVRTFLEMIDKRRYELREIAQPIGKKLFFEKPEYLSGRLGYYWAVKQNEVVAQNNING